MMSVELAAASFLLDSEKISESLTMINFFRFWVELFVYVRLALDFEAVV